MYTFRVIFLSEILNQVIGVDVTFMLTPSRKDFRTSRELCVTMGMELASIPKTEQQYNDVRAFLSSQPEIHDDIWVGILWNKTERVHFWTDTKTSVSGALNSYWSTERGEPNCMTDYDSTCSDDRDQNCVKIDDADGNTYSLETKSCSKAYYALCQEVQTKTTDETTDETASITNKVQNTTGMTVVATEEDQETTVMTVSSTEEGQESTAMNEGSTEEDQTTTTAMTVGYTEEDQTTTTAMTVGYTEEDQTTTTAMTVGYTEEDQTTTTALTVGYTEEDQTTTTAMTVGSTEDRHETTGISVSSTEESQETTGMTVSPTETIQHTSNVYSSNSDMCTCPCDAVGSGWMKMINSNLTLDEIHLMVLKELEQITADIAIDKHKTSKYIRRGISDKDNRKSSVRIGLVGSMFLAMILLFPVIIDCVNLCKNILIYKSNQSRVSIG